MIKKQQTQIDGIQTLNYSGIVSVKIYRKDRLISTKTFHNKGRFPLFKFLCQCLGGLYADENKPSQIKLFNYTSGTSTLASDFNWESEADWKAGITEVSSYITLDATPVIKSTEDEENQQYKITFHFRIPDAYIAGQQINLIGLYGNNAVDPRKDALAYYKFTDENGAWAPLDFSGATGNFTVIIDWTIILQNA